MARQAARMDGLFEGNFLLLLEGRAVSVAYSLALQLICLRLFLLLRMLYFGRRNGCKTCALFDSVI